MTPRKFNLPPGLCICRVSTCTIAFGECHCGCGEKTKIADRTAHKIGWVAGMPTRFIMGHANRQPRIDFSDATPFKIEGVYCKLISLTRGQYAIVDAGDYERVSALYWYATLARNSFYACRKYPTKGKATGKFLYMHRFILGLGLGEPEEGDHKNGVTLDNRRKNLRPLTSDENKQNHKSNVKNTSGREGVSYVKIRNNWLAQMKINGKTKNLGRRNTFEEACALREAAEVEHRGDLVRKKY